MLKKPLVIGGVLLLAAVGLVVTKLGDDGTLKVTITQGMIDAALAGKFPKDKTYLKIVKVTYANPKAVLLPDQEKVLVSLEVKVRVGITGLEKSYTGRASLATGVGYDPETCQFYLKDPELKTFDVGKIPDNYRETLREGLNLIAGEFAGDIPVYKLTKSDTKTHLAKLLLKDVSIRKNKVVVTLGR
ncbi:MAG: DUF1439 domain-containing protein [Verrucomicrobiota bacterium]